MHWIRNSGCRLACPSTSCVLLEIYRVPFLQASAPSHAVGHVPLVGSRCIIWVVGQCAPIGVPRDAGACRCCGFCSVQKAAVARLWMYVHLSQLVVMVSV